MEYNRNPQSRSEELVAQVFAGRERSADPCIARLHFEHRLAEVHPSPRVRNSIKVFAFLTTLLLIGSWAGNLSIPAIDDAQQISIEMPANFSADDYLHWTAIFANHAQVLKAAGGHSLVVDMAQDNSGELYLELGILGIDYSTANEWIRDVIKREPELRNSAYSITQPMVPYSLSVGDMVAFQLGSTQAVERNVVKAWFSIHELPRYMYLIAKPDSEIRGTMSYLYE